jgi:hypothetical protein
MIREATLALLAAACILAGCEEPQVREVKGRLVGTWVGESQEHGGIARRTLTLQSNGEVTETVRLVASGGASEGQSRRGEWSYDGVNLKRRYTFVDGKPLTNAHFIYETHELKSVTASELVASSNVGRGHVRLRRGDAAGHRTGR